MIKTMMRILKAVWVGVKFAVGWSDWIKQETTPVF